MKKENQSRTKERILSLIDAEFESDAAFERAMGLAEKTVNNWRRDRSASYMKMLPELAEKFGVNVTELLNVPLSGDSSELSEEELHLIHLYRKSRILPAPMRMALVKTLETTINLYVDSAKAIKESKK
jgi:transcriptional regulator with XRE-family HTH domain